MQPVIHENLHEESQMQEEKPSDNKVIPAEFNRRCFTCFVYKDIRTDFYKAGGERLGVQRNCKECSKAISREVASGKKQSRLRLEKINETEKLIARILLDDPKTTFQELAKATGLSVGTVRNYAYKSKVLRALRAFANKEITHMISGSLKAYQEILNGNNQDVKFRAATKILESEKVLGPNRLEIGVSDMANESTEHLRQLVKEAKDFPDQTIMEAEVVE